MAERIDPQLAIRRLAEGKLACYALVGQDGELRAQVYWPPEGRNTPPEVAEQLAAILRQAAEASDVPLELVEVTQENAREYLDAPLATEPIQEEGS